MTALFGAAFFLIGAAVAQPIDIPAQDLKTALEEFVRQANVQLVYRIDDLSGRRSGAVTGEANNMAALMRLLKGTGLALRQDSSGAISVFQPVTRPNASNIPAQSIEISSDLPPETVIVTGYRASLGKALEAKRESNGFRDSVMAEDIGKYPTSNVAESLVRIPGVVVVRDTRTDEGKSVTIRGLGSSYTIVTLNGNPIRIVTATSVGSNNRSVDIDGLSADLFSRVDFHKSPEPELDEGGIGGVIDMRTPHPFDYGGARLSYALGLSLNSYRRKASPQGSIQASDIWGPVGVLFAFTFSRNAYELMGSETAGWSQSRNSLGDNAVNTTFDFGSANGGYDGRASIGPYTTGEVEGAYIPRFMSRQHLELEDRARYDGLLSLQYRPSDRLDVTVDALAAKMLDTRSEYTLGPYLRSTETTASGWLSCHSGASIVGSEGCSGVVPLSVLIDKNNNLSGTFANVGWIDENRWYDGDERYANVTAKIAYHISDNVRVTTTGSVAENRALYSDSRIYFYRYNTIVNYSLAGNAKFSTVVTNSDMADPSAYANPAVDANLYNEVDRVLVAKLNGEGDFYSGGSLFGAVTVKAGLSWVSSQKYNDLKSNGSAVMNAPLSNGKTIASMNIADYTVNRLPVTNFLSGISHGERVMNWATVPRAFYDETHTNDILEKQASSLSGLYNVTETVESAFVAIDTDGKMWGRKLQISLGLRYPHTELSGHNFNTGRDSSAVITYTRNTLQNGYDDWLPSAGLAYYLQDDLLARAVFGEAITRPALGSIAQGTTIPDRFGPAAFSGNSRLKPLKSRNIDLGLEWYFAPDSVLSLGVFYKDLKNLLATTTETVAFGTLNLPWSSLDPGVFGATEKPELAIQLLHPVNLNPMVVRGVELYFQEPFDFLPSPFDGMGAMLIFTYTAGATGGTGTGFTANDGAVYKMQINGLSTYTYNATGYYEKGPYSLRASYSWHSKATSSTNYYSSDLLLWSQARGSLDCTLGYRIAAGLEVRLDATNVLDAEEYSFVADGTNGHAAVKAGAGVSRVNYDYLHGSTYILSFRGSM